MCDLEKQYLNLMMASEAAVNQKEARRLIGKISRGLIRTSTKSLTGTRIWNTSNKSWQKPQGSIPGSNLTSSQTQRMIATST